MSFMNHVVCMQFALHLLTAMLHSASLHGHWSVDVTRRYCQLADAALKFCIAELDKQLVS